MFGRIIDAISDKSEPVADPGAVGRPRHVQHRRLCAGRARRRPAGACAPRRRAVRILRARHLHAALLASPARHVERAAHAAARRRDALFCLWLEFMRQHLTTAVALVLLVPTAMSLDVRMSVVLLLLGVAYVAIGRLVMHKTKRRPGVGREALPHVFSPCHATRQQRHGAAELQPHRPGDGGAAGPCARTADPAQYPVLDWWALASALHRLASTISMMVVLLIGAYLVTHGELRIGDIVAFTGFASLLISRLDQISPSSTRCSKPAPGWRISTASKRFRPRAEEPAGAARARPTSPATSASRTSASQFPNSGQGVRDISFEVLGRADRRDRRPDRRRQDHAHQSPAAGPRTRSTAAS